MASQPFWYEDIQADYLTVGDKSVEEVYRGSTLLWEILRSQLSSNADIAVSTAVIGTLDFKLDVVATSAAEIVISTEAAGAIGYGLVVSQVSHGAIDAALATNGEKEHVFARSIGVAQPASISALLAASGGIYINVAPVLELAADARITTEIVVAGELELGYLDFSVNETSSIGMALETSASGQFRFRTGLVGISLGAQSIVGMSLGSTTIVRGVLNNTELFG